MNAKSIIRLTVLVSTGTFLLSISARAMDEEIKNLENARNIPGGIKRAIQDSKSEDLEENKAASNALNTVFWNKEYDDATEKPTSVTRKKRDKLLTELKDMKLQDFLKKYYMNRNDEEFEQQIYIGKHLTSTITTEGQWKAPKNMREAIGLLSSEDVETIFEEEELSL